MLMMDEQDIDGVCTFLFLCFILIPDGDAACPGAWGRFEDFRDGIETSMGLDFVCIWGSLMKSNMFDGIITTYLSASV